MWVLLVITYLSGCQLGDGTHGSFFNSTEFGSHESCAAAMNFLKVDKTIDAACIHKVTPND